MGGYARGNGCKGSRNFADEMSRRDAGSLAPTVELRCQDYRDMLDSLNMDNAVVYLDPPYKGTLGYKSGKFDYDSLVDTVADVARQGALVFVSEFDFPIGDVVWSKERANHVKGGCETRPRVVDKLYMVKA